jgi:glucose/arabinose dehydrogenase
VRPLPAALRASSVKFLRIAAIVLVTTLVGNVLVAALHAPAGRAAALAPGFQETIVWSGLTAPTAIAFASDGRVFVAEKRGVVKVFDSLSDQSPDVFADLRTEVHNYWDRGMLGLALDPAFPERPYVYLTYTHDAAIGGTAPRWGTADANSDVCPDPPGATRNGCVVSGRLSRLTADDGQATGSEDVLIEDWCQQFPSHSVGDLAFAPDGALYVAGGEGASFGFADTGQNGNPCGDPSGQGGALRSQDLRTGGDPVTLDGTVLRVDPETGTGMPGNPLAASSDRNARRIIAQGLRNPYRMALRPGSGELWVGDVGWSTWEEIDRIPNPRDTTIDNFGWPCLEGTAAQAGYAQTGICSQLSGTAPPWLAYKHKVPVTAGSCADGGGSSTTGLAFYQGGSYPSAYDGALFFANYSRKCIYALQRGTNGLPDPARVSVLAASAAAPVDLEIGPNGDLFYADLSGGTIRRISYSNGNEPPVAVVTASPATGPAPLTVTLDASASTDPEGGPLTYAWDLDADGAFDDATGERIERTLPAGTYPIEVQVSDEQGAVATDTVVVLSGNRPPRPKIQSPAEGTRWQVGERIEFSGGASDADEGTIPAERLEWTLALEHCTSGPGTCHEHVIQSWDGVGQGSFVAPDHEYPSYLELRLTATDEEGVARTATRRLQPRTTQLQIASEPTGMRVVVDGQEATTPISQTVILGSEHSVSAAASQTLGGTRYDFASWSDGGAATHNVTADGAAEPLTATWEVHRAATSLTLAASPTSRVWGAASTLITLSGRLTGDGRPLTSAPVEVRSRGAGTSAWTHLADLRTDANGAVSLAGQRPGRPTEYQLRYAGTATARPASSPVVRVSVQTRVTLTPSATSIRRGYTVAFSGLVTPGGGGVVLKLQQWVSGRGWVTTTRTATADPAGAYSITIRPSATTDWRMVATAPGLDEGGSPRTRITVS